MPARKAVGAMSRRRLLLSTGGMLGAGVVGALGPGSAWAATPGAGAAGEAGRDYVKLVNPWVEADRGRFFFFQSASNPFGLVKLRPDTSTHATWGTGYLHKENQVKGFSHLHCWQISGVQVMPTSGEGVPKLEGDTGWESHVNHDAGEVTEPGYHRLHLDRYAITAELTCTDRVGLHRYTYDEAGPGEIVVNLGGVLGEAVMKNARITRRGDREVEGYVFQHGTSYPAHHNQLFFSITFDRPFDSMHGWADGALVEDGAAVGEVEGDDAGFYVRYDRLAAGDVVQMKVALSFTGVAGARRNREAELPGWDFDEVRAASQRHWNQVLGRIDVEGGTEQQQVKFYTDLFHVLCGRSVISDVDGTYLDNTWQHRKIRKIPADRDGVPRFAMYNYDALWLTQWNLNTLLGLAYPEIYSSIVQSQLRMYEDGGLLPRGPVAGDYSWVMTGSPVTSFIAGAWNKGIRDFDVDLAYDAMLDAHSMGGLFEAGSFEYGRWGSCGGARHYLDLGYVPDEVCGGPLEGGAGQTLEYAFQDWTLGQLARRLGKSGINVAQFAEVSVSAQVNDANLAGVRAVDGRPRRSSVTEPVNVGWESGERKPWIKLSWVEKRRVHKVVLSDRAGGDSHVNSGVLWFSDGSSVKVDRVPTDGGTKVVTFRPRRVSWVRFEATGGTGDNVGLHEIEVWDDTDVAAYLVERSGNWRNVFDRTTGFIRPRAMNGRWRDPFDPLSHDDFVEANAWQATWFTSHDVIALANRLGGRKAYADKLNYAFEQSADANFIAEYGKGHVSYGNQPGLQVAHLFNYVGHPWLTQYWVRQVKEKTYGAISTTDGYGHFDEDQGQMGSMSALMAMGLFEVTGASLSRPVYDITSPVFDAVTIELHPDYYRGRTFRIVTHDNSAAHMYIQRARLNGRRQDNAWFHHDQLAAGGELELWMGPEPNKDWGVAELPPSKSPEAPAVLYATRDTVRVDTGETGTLTLAAQNLTDRTVKATWQARTPAGIEIQPARGTLTAPAGDAAEQDLTLRVTDDTARGLHRVVLTGRAADGTELPDAIVYVNVAPVLSVEAVPERLILLQGTPSTVQVQVTSNDVDREHSADVGLKAPDGWTVEPASRSLDVPAGGKATTTFTVTPPADASGEQPLTLTAAWGEDGADHELSATVSRKVALLGSADMTTGEFALSPAGYDDYPETFPDDVDFTIGESDPATAWSYIHPGPNDAWAGSKQHTFTLRFDLDQPPAAGLALTAWLIDTQESGPPTVQVSLNDGPPATVALPKGGGQGFHWGDGEDGPVRPTVLDVALPADRLRAGRNTVTLTNTAGSWMVYDALAVRELS
ncbi:glycoside hydrolase family 92 protein [Streptomyces sp. WMMC500]|uniref:glycoside hydrolase domain-containing protein n=1 Tax=Streptomyces sp. WMMC500 TaxID=3015154 RepID=UPI00248BEF07|nr:glycoside hydrolase domain-containing protein [Streptomyces sp. WMMC500]WBB63394.1 glycoside hydrolase family 92 protein [Streptomyces sp. WMMC500]